MSFTMHGQLHKFCIERFWNLMHMSMFSFEMYAKLQPNPSRCKQLVDASGILA